MDVEKSASAMCDQTFHKLETKTHQENYFKQSLNVTDVKRYHLGRVFIRSRKGPVMKTKIIEQELMLVPLDETIDKLINHPDYKYFVENVSSGAGSTSLDSYMKGQFAKKNKVLQNHPDALRFVLYYDDLEVCAPLKSRAGKHKIGAFYVYLDNIPPKFRGSLKVICLLGLVNANFIKGKFYGMDAALEVIVGHLRKFETGVTLKSGVKVYGTVIATIGDNLGQHVLGGFKEGFTAHRCCRVCVATYDEDMKTMTGEDENLLRTKRQVQEVQTHRGKNEKASTKYGLNRESCLNNLESFHVVENMPPDILHDLLEGSLCLTIKKMLRYYLYDDKGGNPFTLDWLNQAIQNFDFDYAEIKDKPSLLQEDTIKDQTSLTLHQSGAQLWTLATVLPLILSPHITEGDHWENFLDALEITRIAFTLDFPQWLVSYFRDLIEKYLSTYIKLYGPLIPKQHFLVHYPTLILRLGSFVNYNCMRCEAKHKYFKKLTAYYAAFRNITFFLAHRDQLHQAYEWSKSPSKETKSGRRSTVSLKCADYGHLLKTASGEVIETSWLELNGITYKPGRCYIVVGFEDYLPVFFLVKHVIVYPEVAFVCQKFLTTCRHVSAACFLVSPSDELKIVRPQDMLSHTAFHAHSYQDKDPRGVERDPCKNCECSAYEYEASSQRAACSYCECPAPAHLAVLDGL
ncbi:hypothetical protein ONE63_005058 [Megalurothrips usitatus]|uniref:Transposase domain-containing protein n=1 Tax=Megalurothrips usitatus TaxID=439358 RepID=A0AAV7X1M9_9NEOP|nr:hypothetical protein ONE63_005058 [Megalurothrips usitatus]